MIAQAYDTPIGRCTCHDAFAREQLSCPRHGAGFPPLPDPEFFAFAPSPPAPSADYLRGFRAGVDAALAMLGE